MTAEERSDKTKKIIWTAGALIGIILLILGKRKMSRIQKECTWFGLIVYFFAVLGWMDYNVIHIVAGHPCNLMPYWLSLATLYIALTFIVTWHSYMETWNPKIAAKHGLTVFLFLVGAFADWFFFLWAGYVNDLNMQWAWMWQHMVFGWWTGYAQITWSLCIVVVIIGIWIKVRD